MADDILAQTMLDAAYARLDGSGQLLFPAKELDFEGDHDAATREAFGRDGAVHEPTGRKAYHGTLECPLVNTPTLVTLYGERLYPDRYRALQQLFDANPLGQLVHPILGNIRVKIGPWKVKATAEDRGGVVLTLSWVEDRVSVGAVLDVLASDLASPDATSSQARTADAAVAAVSPTSGVPSLSAVTDAQLPVLYGAPDAPPAALSAAFGAMFSAATAVASLPALQTSAGSQAALEVERYRAGVLRLRDRVLPPSPGVYTARATLSIVDVALDVYGTLDAVAGLLAANSLADVSAIPAGTVLTLPPQ